MISDTHQTQGLDDQSPSTQKTPNDKPTQHRLDFGDTAMFRIWRELSNQEASTCSKDDLSEVSTYMGLLMSRTYRKYNKEDILDNPPTTLRMYTQSTTPRMPVFALRVLAISPTAEPFVQVKLSVRSRIGVATESRLQIAHPVANHVDESCNSSTQYSSSDQDDPYLACIRNLLEVA
jgi:hypothetical protein